MCANDIPIQWCQFHHHLSREFIHLADANSGAQQRRVKVDQTFTETLPAGTHHS
jgi:hypothetical protein